MHVNQPVFRIDEILRAETMAFTGAEALVADTDTGSDVIVVNSPCSHRWGFFVAIFVLAVAVREN